MAQANFHAQRELSTQSCTLQRAANGQNQTVIPIGRSVFFSLREVGRVFGGFRHTHLQWRLAIPRARATVARSDLWPDQLFTAHSKTIAIEGRSRCRQSGVYD